MNARHAVVFWKRQGTQAVLAIRNYDSPPGGGGVGQPGRPPPRAAGVPSPGSRAMVAGVLRPDPETCMQRTLSSTAPARGNRPVAASPAGPGRGTSHTGPRAAGPGLPRLSKDTVSTGGRMARFVVRGGTGCPGTEFACRSSFTAGARGSSTTTTPPPSGKFSNGDCDSLTTERSALLRKRSRPCAVSET